MSAVAGFALRRSLPASLALLATVALTVGAGEPVALTGRVLGEAGEPIEGATVRIRPAVEGDDPKKKTAEALVVSTSEDGGFASGETTGFRFDVRVHAEGYAFWTGRDQDASTPLTVQLERGRPLAGRVLDEMTGEGIVGVTLRLDDNDLFEFSGDELEAESDGEGRYRYDHAPTGTLWVRATAHGRATRSAGGQVGAATADAGPATMDDLWLPEGGSASGRVVNAAGKPVAGAEVRIVAADNIAGAHGERYRPIVTRSDDDGRFEVDGVTAGTRYRIRARADGYADGSAGPFTIRGGTALEDVSVVLGDGATLRLRLADEQGHAVTDVMVRIESEVDRLDDRSLKRHEVKPDSPNFETDEKGWITLRRLPPGQFYVRLDPDRWRGLGLEGVVLVEGETTELGTLTVEPGSVLHGSVVDGAGKPVAGAAVEATWRDLYGGYARRTTAGDDGGFTLSGLHEFEVTLKASAEGFARKEIAQVESSEKPVTVKLSREGGIRGSFRLSEGGLPAAATVRALPRRERAEPSGEVEITDGAYEIRKLAPGTYNLEIRTRGRAPGRLRKVEVRAGKVTDAGETLLDAGLALEGVVRGAEGAPVPGAVIRIDRGAGPTSWSGPADGAAASDPTGRFAFDGLETDRYTLTVDHIAFAPVQQSVDLDPDEPPASLEIRLTDGGEIRGRVVDTDGLPVAGADIFIIRGARGYDRRLKATLPDGSFHFPRLAPGTYLIWQLAARGRTIFSSDVRTVEVLAGETTVVEFDRSGS